MAVNLVGSARDPELDVLYDDAAVPSTGSVILWGDGIGRGTRAHIYTQEFR